MTGDSLRTSHGRSRRRIGRFGVLSVLLASCGGDGSASDCTELREPEDSASFQHVIGDIDYQYQSSPPTSGPHVGGPPARGVFAEPLAPVVQVRVLEGGAAVVQYDPAAVDADEVAGYADVGAVVAPGEDLPAPVVVTAWTWKLSCDTVDDDRIREFIDERPADAPGVD